MDSVQDRDNACPNPEFTWPVLLQDFVCKNSVRGGCRWYGQRENHASKTELQPNDLGPFGNAIPSRGCEGTPVCVAQPPLGPLGVCGAAPLLLNAKRV